MVNPNLMGSVLARATRGTDTAIIQMGETAVFLNPPIRVAEEYAMLDAISEGRLVAGFPVGLGGDFSYSYGMAPMEQRAIYYEARGHACARAGVFTILHPRTHTPPTACLFDLSAAMRDFSVHVRVGRTGGMQYLREIWRKLCLSNAVLAYPVKAPKSKAKECRGPKYFPGGLCE